MAADEKGDPFRPITRQLEEIKALLKQTCEAFVRAHESESEFVSDESLLLEEGLAQERGDQEDEHDLLRDAIRRKTLKERQRSRARLLRQARALIAEQNKNSQVWDDSSSASKLNPEM